MKEHAAERIADLNERGYASAGLYDPAGVGGTHVMYVLKDAKNPQNVNLPVDPTISPLVSFWKGITKPLAGLALGAIALGGFLHYITVGPKEEPVDDDDRRGGGDAGRADGGGDPWEADRNVVREARRDRLEDGRSNSPSNDTRRDL